MLSSVLRGSVVGLLVTGTVLAWVGCRSNNPASVALQGAASDDDEDDDDAIDMTESDITAGTPPVPGARTTEIPSKIRYVLVLVKENHTFDSYFTGFPGADSSKTAKLSNGTTITRKPAPLELTKDLCHRNSCLQAAYNKGKMDGFDRKDPVRPFYYYPESQIPNYWQYARNFVLADNFFTTTMGPSTPGHTVFWAGQSLVLDNAKCRKDGGACTGRGCTAGADIKVTAYDPDTCATKTVSPCFDVPSLTDHLPNGFTWSVYGATIPRMIKSVTADPNYGSHIRKQEQLVGDLQAGNIANLTVAHLVFGEESEHPPAYPCAGENFSVDIINAAMKLPQWKEMAIVLTWDDSGGWYDHAKPPVRRCANGQVYQFGFRVPAIVISPYAKKGFILKSRVQQASVPRLVEELWGMEFMTKRDPHAMDGVAGSLLEAFDFDQAPRDPLVLEKRTCP